MLPARRDRGVFLLLAPGVARRPGEGTQDAACPSLLSAAPSGFVDHGTDGILGASSSAACAANDAADVRGGAPRSRRASDADPRRIHARFRDPVRRRRGPASDRPRLSAWDCARTLDSAVDLDGRCRRVPRVSSEDRSPTVPPSRDQAQRIDGLARLANARVRPARSGVERCNAGLHADVQAGALDRPRFFQPADRDAAVNWFENDEFWTVLAPIIMFQPQSASRAAIEASAISSHVRPGASILDLGCGPGHHALPLAALGYKVTAVDRCPHHLDSIRRSARERSLVLDVVEADMRAYHKTDAFDAAINLGTTFGFFDDREDDGCVVSNLLDSLRSGGLLIMDMVGKEIMRREFAPRAEYVVGEGLFTVV